MKINPIARCSLFSLLVTVILFSNVRRTSAGESTLNIRTTSPPGPPLPVEHFPDPFSLLEFPLTQTINDIQSMLNPIPISGDQPLIVILVDFDDQQGSFTLQEWEEYFFGADGFVDYFNEVSHGGLRYSGDVVGMLDNTPIIATTSIAYVRLPNQISYYADNLYGFGDDFPMNNAGVVYDALSLLDESGFDFLPYSNPANGRVENLVVIFAGSNYGYTGDIVNSLEATAFSLSQGGIPGGYVSNDGLIFDNFTFCPEKFGAMEGEIAHLGVCVHEHGHALGMFDLYDRSYSTAGSGRFDLMAYGSYGASDGSRPFHPGVFTKQHLGWIQPSVFLGGSWEFYLSPAEMVVDRDFIEDYPQFIKIYPRGDVTADEYFILENRQPILFSYDDEWWDAGLCPGLVIWHVDESIAQDYALVNRVNTTGPEPDYPPHPGVIIVEADGRYDMITPLNPLDPETSPNYGECTDTWQIGSNWSDASIPSARLWDGRTSHISVKVLYQVGSYLRVVVEMIEYDHQMYLPAIQR